MKQNELKKMKGGGELPQSIVSNMKIIDEMGTRRVAKFEDTWQFQCDGEKTLVSGSLTGPPSQNMVTSNQHYYENNKGVIVNLSHAFEKDKQRQNGPLNAPTVWGCPGDCVRYRSAFLHGLDLTPEDFALLAQKNPLTMYGVEWKLQSETPEKRIYTAEITKGERSPCTITLTLDKQHDNLPSLIECKGRGWEAVYRVTDYKQQGEHWLPAKIDSFDRVGNDGHQVTRNWTLISVEPSSKIAFVLPKKSEPVEDYRLMGTNLTVGKAIAADGNKNPAIKRYTAEGIIPSEGVLVPHLSGRRHVYNYPNPFYSCCWGATVQALEQQEGNHFEIWKTAEYRRSVNSAPVEYVAFCPQINTTLPSEIDDEILLALFRSPNYGIVAVGKYTLLFRRGADHHAGLRKLSDFYQVEAASEGECKRIIFCWQRSLKEAIQAKKEQEP